jgi:thioredoxin reductase
VDVGTDRSAGQAVDVGVIGAGYAGLSAAIGLRRHRLGVLLFDGGPARNAAAAEVHGYLGGEGVSAQQLLQRGRQQAASLGARIMPRQVCTAEPRGDGFALEAEDGSSWQVRRLVLATGVRDRMPQIEGVDAFYGRSLHVCPHCDAYEWRDRPIAIISWTSATRDFALKVSNWSRQVTVVTDGRRPRLSDEELAELQHHGIAVRTADIARLEGDAGRLRAISFVDGSALPVEAAFFSLGQDYATELAGQLGCRLREDNSIEVSPDLHTSVEGVWAVGDVAGDSQFVAVAVAHGIKAAIDVHRTLSESHPEAKKP